MNKEIYPIDITLSDDTARKLTSLCAITGETPEEKIASILEEMLKDEEKVLAILAQTPREGES